MVAETAESILNACGRPNPENIRALGHDMTRFTTKWYSYVGEYGWPYAASVELTDGEFPGRQRLTMDFPTELRNDWKQLGIGVADDVKELVEPVFTHLVEARRAIPVRLTYSDRTVLSGVSDGTTIAELQSMFMDMPIGSERERMYRHLKFTDVVRGMPLLEDLGITVKRTNRLELALSITDYAIENCVQLGDPLASDM